MAYLILLVAFTLLPILVSIPIIKSPTLTLILLRTFSQQGEDGVRRLIKRVDETIFVRLMVEELIEMRYVKKIDDSYYLTRKGGIVIKILHILRFRIMGSSFVG